MKINMNKKFIDSVKIIILVAVLTIGASYIYADWTSPPGPPPGCPTSEPGCNVPINVSASTQTKTGGLFASDITAVHTMGVNLTQFVTNALIKLQVNGKVGADAYCDQAGNNCIIPPGGGGSGLWQVDPTDPKAITNINQGKVNIASKIRIAGGKPAEDKVLVAQDSTGLARWRYLAELGVADLVGSCRSGEAIQSINADRTVTCVNVNSGSNTVGRSFLFTILSLAAMNDILTPDTDGGGSGGGGCRECSGGSVGAICVGNSSGNPYVNTCYSNNYICC